MGGQQGSRGYLYQSVISIFTACVENTWDYISVEYTTKQDKVDIALNSMDGEVIKAIQVKSSINLFTKENIISWLKDIINDVDAQEYQLVLIGNCEKNANTFIKSIGKYYHDASLDNETKTSLGAFITELKKKNIKVTLFPYEENHFLSVTRDALFRFISAKGYIIDFSILESICHALISLSMFLSTKGSSISRADYESKIINWLITSANGGIKTNTKYSALTINIVNQKDSLLQETGNSIPFCELPGLLNYRNRILESGMSLILEIKKIELNKFDESCVAELPTTAAPSFALDDRFKGIDWNRFAQARSAEWGDEEKSRTKANIQEYWGTTVDDCFFYVGNLMESSLFASMTGRNELKGSDIEKQKYNMLCDLSWKIHILKDVDHLNRILQNVHIIPLCISNISDISDKNISVTIRTADKNAKLFSIEDDIVGDDRILLDAFADTLINEKVIENALEIVPDEVIDLEPQSWSSPTNYLPPLFTGKRKMDYDDLINEWATYQVDVETNGLISYSFAMLRPGENKWLSPYLIVVPKGDSMVFEYTILSEYSEKRIRGYIKILTTKTEL